MKWFIFVLTAMVAILLIRNVFAKNGAEASDTVIEAEMQADSEKVSQPKNRYQSKERDRLISGSEVETYIDKSKESELKSEVSQNQQAIETPSSPDRLTIEDFKRSDILSSTENLNQKKLKALSSWSIYSGIPNEIIQDAQLLGSFEGHLGDGKTTIKLDLSGDIVGEEYAGLISVVLTKEDGQNLTKMETDTTSFKHAIKLDRSTGTLLIRAHSKSRYVIQVQLEEDRSVLSGHVYVSQDEHNIQLLDTFEAKRIH